MARKGSVTTVAAAGNSTAFSALLNLKRRINSNQKFQNMCFLDPGHLLTFEASQLGANERRARSLFSHHRMAVPVSSAAAKNAV